MRAAGTVASLLVAPRVVPRVLTVGDGNLSFSDAYVTRFPDRAAATVATTYDSEARLRDKYPDVKRRIDALKRRGVTVCHDVNATALKTSLLPQLQPSPLPTPAHTEPASVNAALVRPSLFDVIVFQFPHLGVDSPQRHYSLLAHFFDSAVPLLSGPAKVKQGQEQGQEQEQKATHTERPLAQVQVTLCADQAERWCLQTAAERSGMRLTSTVPFCESDWPEYENKRHQTDKAFPLIDSITYLFSRMDNKTTAALRRPVPRFASGESKGTQEHGGAARRERKRGRAAVNISAEAAVTGGPVTILDTSKQQHRKKKREKQVDAVPRYGPDGTMVMEHCGMCDREFQTKRSLNDHLKNKHHAATSTATATGAAAAAGAASPDAAPAVSEYRCSLCQRTFRDQEALRQHALSRHSEASASSAFSSSATHVITGSAFSSSATHVITGSADAVDARGSAGASAATFSSSSPQECTCDVCGVVFPHERSLRAHERELAPVDAVFLTCTACGDDSKAFADERALLQHTLAVHTTHVAP